MTQYIEKGLYRQQKARLTVAVNSGDPVKVLAAVEKTLGEWEGLIWPDAWHRWSVALYDALLKYRRHPYDDRLTSVVDRFEEAARRFNR